MGFQILAALVLIGVGIVIYRKVVKGSVLPFSAPAVRPDANPQPQIPLDPYIEAQRANLEREAQSQPKARKHE